MTAKGLRQFSGMINFYRRWIPRPSDTQAPLNDLLVSKIKSKAPIDWTQETTVALEECKRKLDSVTLSAHPLDEALLAIVSDALNTAVEVIFQQLVDE